MSYVEKTDIEIKIQPPRETGGYPYPAAYISNGRLRLLSIEKWGYSDESGSVPVGREGMTRAEFEHFAKSVLAGFDVEAAAVAARDALKDNA